MVADFDFQPSASDDPTEPFLPTSMTHGYNTKVPANEKKESL